MDCGEYPWVPASEPPSWRSRPGAADVRSGDLREDEIRPDFTIDEPDSGALRKRFLAENAALARELQAAETRRRERKAAKDEAEDPADQDASEPDEAEAD